MHYSLLDFSAFMTGVIDKASFKSISSYIDYARKSDTAEIIYGGKCKSSEDLGAKVLT